MPQYTVLKKAPITEALIDLRVKLPSTVDVAIIDSLFEKIKERYPVRQVHKLSHFSLQILDDVPKTSAEQNINGYRYISSDKKQIVQARLDGFTFSRLHPYTEWKDLRDEARRIWQLYKEITKPVITRVALRYINNLNIPLPIKDFEEYLSAPPIVPNGLPQEVGSFLTRVSIGEPEIPGVNAFITQALEPSQLTPEITRIPVILDIDVFRYEPNGLAEDDAWYTIEQLRDFKNRIFFQSITEKLKETYL